MIIKKSKINPILKPNPNNQWEERCVLNPGVIYDEENKEFIMLIKKFKYLKNISIDRFKTIDVITSNFLILFLLSNLCNKIPIEKSIIVDSSINKIYFVSPQE